MNKYPVYFDFDESICGNDFLAKIKVRGKALLVQESDNDWWLYGVQPGSLAEGGATYGEAYAKFSSAFKSALADIASETSTFASFKKEANIFFNEINEVEKGEWERVRETIRKAKRIVKSPLKRTIKQNQAGRITITPIIKCSAKYNHIVPPDSQLVAAA